MANPLSLPFDFPPNATPTTHQIQANFNALLGFVQDLNDGAVVLNNFVANNLTALTAMKLPDGSVNSPALQFINSPGTGLFRVGPDNLGIVTDQTLLWDADQDGHITLPVQPAFLAEINTFQSNVFGDNLPHVIDWETEVIDRSGAFNMATNTFTAAVDGVYCFVVGLRVSNVQMNTITPSVSFVTSNQTYTGGLPEYQNQVALGIATVFTFMDANDTMQATVNGDGRGAGNSADIDSGYIAGFLFG